MQLYIQIEGDALVSMQRIFTIQEMNTLNKTLYETRKKYYKTNIDKQCII